MTPASPPSPSAAVPATETAPGVHRNEVVLVGRVSAGAEARALPSGDRLVTLRVVVDRPPVRGSTRRTVDVIDVACWSRRTQRSAERLAAQDGVRVEGALRRRFFAGAAGRASRYEVEATRLTRVRLPAAS
jgi:single-strand DNA-binding protein